jgi:hypothetical protein
MFLIYYRSNPFRPPFSCLTFKKTNQSGTPFETVSNYKVCNCHIVVYRLFQKRKNHHRGLYNYYYPIFKRMCFFKYKEIKNKDRM